jgi:hypothetical protein
MVQMVPLMVLMRLQNGPDDTTNLNSTVKIQNSLKDG